MFNNANVIFQTKFVDGVSTVSKTIGIGSSTRTKQGVLTFSQNSDQDGPVKKHAAGGDHTSGK